MTTPTNRVASIDSEGRREKTMKRRRAVRRVCIGTVAAAVSAIGLAVALPAFAAGPPAPIIGGSIPGSSSDDNKPAIHGNAQLGTVVKIYASADCTGAVAVCSNAERIWKHGLIVIVTVY